MLVEIPPKMSVSGFMGYLKGKSSLMLYEQFGDLKFKYRNREFWCRGDYVDTVGKNTAKIQDYIKHQLEECSCPLISRQGLYLKLTLPADVDILAESDNPTHYADGFHCNARSPLQGYAMPFLHSVSA